MTFSVVSKIGSLLVAYVLFFALVMLGVFIIDTHKSNEVEQTQSTSILSQNKHEKSPKVLVLLIDGLRYQTATNPEIMPFLDSLEYISSYAKLETIFDAYSIPSIRTAFTGRKNSSLTSVIDNFFHKSLLIESFFSQCSSLQRKVAISSNLFVIFGNNNYDDITAPKKFPQENLYIRDDRSAKNALDIYKSDEYDIVVSHYETTDWLAHQYGIYDDKYKVGFHRADSIIKAYFTALREDDYLLVFGDHGHNERGEHKTGMDIPSIVFLYGPNIDKGKDVGTVHIRDIRYLLSRMSGIDVNTISYNTSLLDDFFIVTNAQNQINNTQHKPQKRRGFYFYIDFIIWIFIFIVYSYFFFNNSLDLKKIIFITATSLLLLIDYTYLALLTSIVFFFYYRTVLYEISKKVILVIFTLLVVSELLVLLKVNIPFSLTPLIFYATSISLILVFSYAIIKKHLTLQFIVFTSIILVFLLFQINGFSNANYFFILIASLIISFLPTINNTTTLQKVSLFVAVLIFYYLITNISYNTDWYIHATRGLSNVKLLYAGGILSKLVLFYFLSKNKWIRIINIMIAVVLILDELWILNNVIGVEQKYLSVILALTLLVIYVLSLKYKRELSNSLLLFIAYIMLHHTLRVPIYILMRFDLLLLVLIIIYTLVKDTISHRNLAFFYFVSLISTYSLLLLWVEGTLEWQFLYDWFSIPDIEQNIIRYSILILLKIPIPVFIVFKCLDIYHIKMDYLQLKKSYFPLMTFIIILNMIFLYIISLQSSLNEELVLLSEYFIYFVVYAVFSMLYIELKSMSMPFQKGFRSYK